MGWHSGIMTVILVRMINSGHRPAIALARTARGAGVPAGGRGPEPSESGPSAAAPLQRGAKTPAGGARRQVSPRGGASAAGAVAQRAKVVRA